MTDGHWQLDGSSPELYQRYLVPAITTKWAEDLVCRTQPHGSEAVLDIACALISAKCTRCEKKIIQAASAVWSLIEAIFHTERREKRCIIKGGV
jgi:hypothetical protein